MCCAGRWACAIGGTWQEGTVGCSPHPGGCRCHRQEQLCQLHSEHPSCPWSAGGSLTSYSTGHTWNPELSPSSPPSLNPSPCCAFIPQRWVLGRGDALAQLLPGLAEFCWCVVDVGTSEYSCWRKDCLWTLQLESSFFPIQVQFSFCYLSVQSPGGAGRSIIFALFVDALL